MNQSPDRLTPDERELASRLARIGPHGEPPAAMDARILSAAHAAVAAPPARRRRWPAALGVAATLMLAIGVTWQLRPRPDASPALQKEAAPAEAAPPAAKATSEAADTAAVAPSADATGAVVAEQPAASKAAAPEGASAPSQGRRAPLRAMARPPEEPPVVIETQEADDVATVPSPAPAPPPVAAPAPVTVTSRPVPVLPAPDTSKAAAASAPATVTVTGSTRTAEQATSPPSAADAQRQETLSRMGGRAVHDVPVDQDARLGAYEWLDRIRLRRDAGDLAGARASLMLFRRYHPGHPIPEDLAPLAQ